MANLDRFHPASARTDVHATTGDKAPPRSETGEDDAPPQEAVETVKLSPADRDKRTKVLRKKLQQIEKLKAKPHLLDDQAEDSVRTRNLPRVHSSHGRGGG